MKNDLHILPKSPLPFFWQSMAVLMLASLSGCVYLNPYVAMNVPDRPKTTAMPQLSAAIKNVDDSLKSAESLRNQTSQLQRTLNLLTFGFGMGAGGASIYGAHRDAVTGLGLGAAASYTGSTLFAPADQTTLYDGAISTLMCIRTTADYLNAIVDTIEQRRATDLADDYIGTQLGCDSASANSADLARRSAIGALDGAKNADKSAATSVNGAGLNVIRSLNYELTQRAPNVQTVLAAAKSAVPMAASMATPAPSTTPKAVAMCGAAADAQAKTFESRYKKAETEITSAINALGALDTACVFNVPPIPVLSVNQTQITVEIGNARTISISGGRTPYKQPYWKDKEPPGLSARLEVPATIVLTAASTAKPGGPYILVVPDSSTVPVEKEITVTVR